MSLLLRTRLLPPASRQLEPGTIEIRYLIYRQSYGFGGLCLPLPKPGPARKFLGMLYCLAPGLLIPLFLLGLELQPFTSWHRSLALVRISPELLYFASAWILTALIQLILSIPSPLGRAGREGWAVGLLLAPALYAMLRGWGVISLTALIVTGAAWALISILSFFPSARPARIPGIE